MSKIESSCKVCDQPASAFHFGVLSCRACAAFFRRKVKEQKHLKCQCEKKIKLEQKSRKMCASCRFKRCLKVGMKRPKIPSKTPSFRFESGPILVSWRNGYEKLEETRKQVFGVTEEKVSQSITYSTQNNLITIDSKLIVSSLIGECARFGELDGIQQKRLLSQFIGPFHILEGSYKSTEPNLHILANGDYVDRDELPKYYKDHELAFRVFRPYWESHRRILRTALDEVRLDSNEFLLLLALMFWDIDFHECEEEFIMVCLEEKSKIMAELCDYEKQREILGELQEDRSMRTGRIVMMLQGMQRILHMMHESYEVSQIYQVDSIHDKFFDMLMRGG